MVEGGGVCVSGGWPIGLRCLGSSRTTLPLSHLVAAVLGVHSAWPQQGVTVGDSVCKCVSVSMSV